MSGPDNLTDQERAIVAAWEKSGVRPDDPTEARIFATLHERGILDDQSPPKPKATTKRRTTATKK